MQFPQPPLTAIASRGIQKRHSLPRPVQSISPILHFKFPRHHLCPCQSKITNRILTCMNFAAGPEQHINRWSMTIDWLRTIKLCDVVRTTAPISDENDREQCKHDRAKYALPLRFRDRNFTNTVETFRKRFCESSGICWVIKIGAIRRHLR